MIVITGSVERRTSDLEYANIHTQKSCHGPRPTTVRLLRYNIQAT
jgi:hypothetical protein